MKSDAAVHVDGHAPRGQSTLMSNDLFDEIRKTSRGQLRPNVYREIYKVALEAPPGDFVEIGTAHGAATVALALALKDAARSGRVHTFGRPGVGSHIGDPRELKGVFQHFGVDDVITAHIAEASAARALLPEDLTIGLLMLDADGRIDRDFGNLFDRVVPGAPLIIDDYAEQVSLKLGRSGRALGVGLKHKLTYVLANYFRACGYVDEFRVVNNTLFCRKSATAPGFKIDPEKLLDLYGSMLFTWQALDGKQMRSLAGSFVGEIRGKLRRGR